LKTSTSRVRKKKVLSDFSSSFFFFLNKLLLVLVQGYTTVLRDFPINALISASDLDSVLKSLEPIGVSLKKLKGPTSKYPVKSAALFVEAISRDLTDRMINILYKLNLMSIDFSKLQEINKLCQKIFSEWEELVKDVTNTLKSMKRTESFKGRINSAHESLQKRIKAIYDFRDQHHQLCLIIGKVLKQISPEQGDSHNLDLDLEDVTRAFEPMKSADVLNLSAEGVELYQEAENHYNEEVSRVEDKVISIIKSRLEEAKNARDMFRVFSQFNPLLVRPKIKGAVNEYQTQLIESVKADINALKKKVTDRYQESEAASLSAVRDIPEVSGIIIWTRQIERQLDTYVKRVEAVLTEAWKDYKEGHRLHGEIEHFKRLLEVKPLFDDWVAKIESRKLKIAGPIFSIRRDRATDKLELQVNFDPHVVNLFKECRNLQWLGLSVPSSITNLAQEAKKIYPYAISLTEALRIYDSSCKKIDEVDKGKGDLADLGFLVAGIRKEVQKKLAQGWHY